MFSLSSAQHFLTHIWVIIIINSNAEKYQSEEDSVKRQENPEENSHYPALMGWSNFVLFIFWSSSWSFVVSKSNLLEDISVCVPTSHYCIAFTSSRLYRAFPEENLNIHILNVNVSDKKCLYFFDWINYDNEEWICHREQHPGIDHLDVSCGGEISGDSNEAENTN